MSATNTERFLKYDAFQCVEIKIKGVAGGQKAQVFNFPDLPYLRPDAARIVGIETYTRGTSANSPVSNTPLFSNLNIINLTLYGGIENPENGISIKQGNQIIQQLPLLRLNSQASTNDAPYNNNIFLLNNMVVDWTKSQINFTEIPDNEIDLAVIFGVYFNFKKQFN